MTTKDQRKVDHPIFDDAEAMLRALMFAATDPFEVADRITLDVVREALTAEGWSVQWARDDDQCWSNDARSVVLWTEARWHRDTVLRAAFELGASLSQCSQSEPRAIVLARWLLASLARST